MEQHLFVSAFLGEDGTIQSAQCARCTKIVPFEHGKIPDGIRDEECPGKPADGLRETLPCTRRDDD
jgi:hypothetical protein